MFILNNAAIFRQFLGLHALKTVDSNSENWSGKLNRVDYKPVSLNCSIFTDCLKTAIQTHMPNNAYLNWCDVDYLFKYMITDIDAAGLATQYKTVNSAELRIDLNAPNYIYSEFFNVDRDKLQFTPIKIGKWLSTYTLLTEVVISMALDMYISQMNPDKYAATVEYKFGSTRADMRLAYSADSPVPQNWRLTPGNYKKIHSSCMQGGIDNDSQISARYDKRESWNQIHPSEAYATDDLEIHYLVNRKTGLCVARVIIGANRDCAQPIYCDSAMAGNCLSNHIKEKRGKTPESMQDDFHGLELKLLHTRQGYVATPYIDFGYYTFDGDTLQFGDSDFNGTTAGFTRKDRLPDSEYNNNMESCDHCHDDTDSDELTYIESEGHSVCNYCLRTHYTQSDISQDYFPDSDMTTAINSRGCRIDLSNSELEDGDFQFCDHESEYIDSELMVETVCGVWIYRDNLKCVELNDCYYIEDSDEHIAAIEDNAEKDRLALVLYCARPLTRCDMTPDMLAA